MICIECGGEYIEKHGRLELNDPFVGQYHADDVFYYQCSRCGIRLFPRDAALKIEEKRDATLNALVRSMPLGSFLTATEASAILGISRQALHKHRRIRRGFIFQTKFGGKTVYLKESVRRYKRYGDGRFPLVQTGEKTKRKRPSKMPVCV